MDICKGEKYTRSEVHTRYRKEEGTPRGLQREKSQDALGTEGTRVHQVTNEHQQWTKVSRYTRYRRDEGTPRYR